MRLPTLVSGLLTALFVTWAVGTIWPALDAAEPGEIRSDVVLESPAFWHRQRIPPEYTCEGEGIFPPLAWYQVPEGTQSLVVVMQDSDYPRPIDPSRQLPVHWVVYDIPADNTSLEPPRVPAGARVGINDFGQRAYRAPCPAVGLHSYVFELYALDTTLGLPSARWPDIRRAMVGHVLSRARLIGLYRLEDD